MKIDLRIGRLRLGDLGPGERERALTAITQAVARQLADRGVALSGPVTQQLDDAVADAVASAAGAGHGRPSTAGRGTP